MTPHLELGAGLIFGFIAAAFIFWGINVTRSKKVFTDRESAKMLRVAERILSEIDVPSLIVDSEANVIFANETVRELDGSNDLYRLISEPHIRSEIVKVLLTGSATGIEPNLSGGETSLRLHIFSLDTQHGVVIASDTGSESRIMAMRRDFITNMSHEIKTPVAAIGLLSEALLKASDSPDVVKRFSAKLRQESLRLNDLSRDVIKLSEAQTPLLPAESKKFDVLATLEHEVAAHLEIASQHQVKLKLKKSQKLKNAFVHGRESALSAALANLISNALNHSPKNGEVEISISKSRKEVLITVTDHGPGIDLAHQDRIFERFFRLDESRSRQNGGTGLGLSIVRNAARTHGGDATVRSKPGSGATFLINIPLAKQKER